MAILESVGPVSGYLAVLVLAIYISTPLAEQLYRHPKWLWLLCPVLLYWVTRIWFLARRRALTEDPILFALTDRISWVAGAVCGLIVIAAARDWW
jgi:4-hydroxybenzoate polyprenyltransferase